MKVKLLRTIKNGFGDVFRKNSVVEAEKRYGGYHLTKNRRRKDGCVICVTRVQKEDFELTD